MNDLVKASLVIGIAIVISQGVFEIQSVSGSSAVVKMNKFTGNSEICHGKNCFEQKQKSD